eukprot:scaffold961_cov122-Cylindrotheca_fusiformis.AAC.20
MRKHRTALVGGVLLMMIAYSDGFTMPSQAVGGNRIFAQTGHWEQQRLVSATRFNLGKPNESTESNQAAANIFSFEEFSSALAIRAQEALSPVARAVDTISGGWALGYADLSPENEATPVGQAFLATNIGYAVAGVLLTLNGDTLLGGLTEVASIASFIYHYTQLQATMDPMKDKSVRFALLVDYICACSAILVGLVYLAMDHQIPPTEALLSGGAGIGCLVHRISCRHDPYGAPMSGIKSLLRWIVHRAKLLKAPFHGVAILVSALTLPKVNIFLSFSICT